MGQSKLQTPVLPLEMNFGMSFLEDGALVAEATYSRGLVSQRFTYSERGTRSSAKQRLSGFASQLRGILERDGIATDRDYVWIREGQGEWHPDRDVDVEKQQPYELCCWVDQMRRVTEPLSVGRLRGELLHALNEILAFQSLENVDRLLRAYKHLVLAELGNPLFYKARRARERLAQGPRTKRNQSSTKLQIVCRHAEYIWRQRACLRGDRSNTAAEIVEAVNEEFQAYKFKKVSQKTVASYIADGISGGLFATG
jgi:hypothetical protein